MAEPAAEEEQAVERPMKRPRSSTAPVGALAIAHQLKAGSADEQAAAAQALLDDDEQLFPQKRARLLQWVVDALIRSQKACRGSNSASAEPSAEPVHSTLHWRLLAQLIPGSDTPVHADLACAVMAAADACASDGVLEPPQQQLLQHAVSVLTDLSPLHFRPRMEALRDVLSSLCALATRVLFRTRVASVPSCGAPAVVLQLSALAARMLTAALRQSSNMKRNFTLVIDMLPRLVSLRGAIVDDAGRAEREHHDGAPELLAALDALLSAAMFRPEQLSDYHLAFTATRGRAVQATATLTKNARGLASYQSQLFKTLRALVLADEQHVQVASCAAVAWVFICFVGAMRGTNEVDSAQQNGVERGLGPDAQHRTVPNAVKGLSTRISAKAGFDCFVECHRILEPLTASPIHALRAAALRSSNILLATLDSNGIYRHTVDENADAHSRSAVHATLREVWHAVMVGSETYNRAAVEPDLWYANGAVAQCTKALIKLDHQSIDAELVDVWGMLERMRDGQLLGRQNSCSPARRADADQALAHLDACCTELVHQIVSTYERLYQMLPLLESLLLAIRKGLVKSDTIVTFGVCGALRNAAPLLPCSQLPPIFGAFRVHLLQCMEVSRGDQHADDQHVVDTGAVDATVALFVIILQYCSVDEASSDTVHSELELLNSELLGPALHSEQSGFKAGCGQPVAHLRRAAVALEFRLQYQKPLNEVQSIRPMSVLGTWRSTLTPEQQRMTDHCDLAATCVALQRIAVLHDSIHSLDAQSDSSRSEQIAECLAYIWRDIDEMQRNSVEAVMSVTTRAKWQQIAANIFLLSKCSSKDVMEKFFSSVVALLSRENTQNADSDCLAAAHTLVQDHRFCELESFREVCLAVVAARIQQLSSKLSVKPWVTTLFASLRRLDSAVEDTDAPLIKHLSSRRAPKDTTRDKQFREDVEVLGSSMAGLASVMKFVRSLPTGVFDIKQMLQCVRLSCAVEAFCDAGASTQASDVRCRAAWVEARRLLGWSLAIVCRRRTAPEVQAAKPLIDAACRRFLDWPVGISEEDWSCPHIRQYRDAVVDCMRSIATDLSRDESAPIKDLLPSVFATESVQTASSRWCAFYYTAFLNQANHEIDARLQVARGSLRHDDISATGFKRHLQASADLIACAAVLEHCAKLTLQVDASASSCTYLRAMAALLDARRIITVSSSERKPGGLLGLDLARSVAVAAKLLASHDVPQDVHQSCLELISATTRALQLFEPQLSPRDLGCLLAVVFRVHSKSLLPQMTKSALSVFEGVVMGAGTEQVELLLLTVQSELTTCAVGDRTDLLRVWTAIEVLRVTEETIRSHSLRHKRLLQTHAAGLTQALLHQIHDLQHARKPDEDEIATKLPWHTVTSAATRNLARLVHYTATSGMREARQTACLLQVVERMSTALSGYEGQVILAGATAVLELLTEMVKMCARDVLQCMPMFISCTRKILTTIWSLSSCLHTSTRGDPDRKERWGTAAAQLCSLYELLPKALNAPALRRYVPYLLSNYIDAALWHGDHSYRRPCISQPPPPPILCGLIVFVNHNNCWSCGHVCSQHAPQVGGHTRSKLDVNRVHRLRHPLPQPL